MISITVERLAIFDKKWYQLIIEHQEGKKLIINTNNVFTTQNTQQSKDSCLDNYQHLVLKFISMRPKHLEGTFMQNSKCWMGVTEKARCWRFLKMSILPLCLLVWLSYKACIALDNTVQLKECLADNSKAKDSSPPKST